MSKISESIFCSSVTGVLEANFIEPAHDKQDFERTSVFLRLEGRLKAMTIEYWWAYIFLCMYKFLVSDSITCLIHLSRSHSYLVAFLQ